MNILFFLKKNLLNKKNNFFSRIKSIFKIEQTSDDYFKSLYDTLLESDVGLDTTEKILKLLKTSTNKNLSKNELDKQIFEIFNNILSKNISELSIEVDVKPFILLVCGVNGVGKTSTVCKIANFYKCMKKKVAVVAADTYRAAAIEQLSQLCEKNNIPVFKQHYGADSASVVYDSIILAKKKEFDLLIIDTSGRLHTNEYLMLELSKIEKVVKKIDGKAPHEVLMIIDANFGQNSINQFKSFNKYISISSLCITKFDGTSKGGVILNLVDTFNIPVRYFCFGEKIEDIALFKPDFFFKKLL